MILMDVPVYLFLKNIILFSCFLCFSGTWLMWKSKKIGFWFYLTGGLSPYFLYFTLPGYFIFTRDHVLSAIFLAATTILFTILLFTRKNNILRPW